MGGDTKNRPSDIPHDLARFCVIDVGSTTTKAILFTKKQQWSFCREESPTTVEKPYEDVTYGVLNAMRALEARTGEKLLNEDGPAIPLFSTSSAGGGLSMVVAGLVRDVTAQSAERAALGAGAIIQDVVALDDGRTPYKKIEILKNLRPDMLLLAGGFDNGSIFGPVFTSEIICQSDLRPKLNRHLKLPVLYAGNVKAQDHVKAILGDRFMYHCLPNIRPFSDKENLEPARDAIHDLFMEHVMSRAPGYEKYSEWVSAPILPTPSAVERILRLASVDMNARILAVDIGGATTDVYSAAAGKVFRSVSANLGMSYSALNVVKKVGVDAIRELLDFDISEQELLDRVGNKFLRPTTLPDNMKANTIECAVASVAIREAVKEHLRVLRGVAVSLSDEDLGWHMFKQKRRKRRRASSELLIDDYDLIIGSGGRLSHSPRNTTAMILLNALNPHDSVDLAVDNMFMFPHLGVLSQVDSDLALQLFYELALVRLGKLVAPSGQTKPRSDTVKVIGSTSTGSVVDTQIKLGDVKFIRLQDGESLKAEVRSKGLKPKKNTITVEDPSGLVVDARGRPPVVAAPFLLKPEDTPPPRTAAIDEGTRVSHGEIRITRELAIPGDMLVKRGDRVAPDQIIAKSTRAFR
ncbi:MAG: hypothetical protein DRP45_08310, partial [Candidatus Zixiibacteriota bacterium]